MADDPGKGIEGVTLSFGGVYGIATTAADGTWSKARLEGTVIVMPDKPGWNFSPPGRRVSEASNSIDFVGRPISVGAYGVLQVAGGEGHTVALRTDGTVWAWGSNEYGQLGNGSWTDSLAPVQVVGLSQVTAVAAGQHHSLALRADGTVWAWGSNSLCQLGGWSYSRSSKPVQVDVGGIRSIAAGANHNLAVSYAGTVQSWGGNEYGQLGNGQWSYFGDAWPGDVVGLQNVTCVAAGRAHSLAIEADGTLWAWGYNSFGQLGDGSCTNRTTPVGVRSSGIGDAAAVAAGSDHSLAIGQDGRVWAWGNNAGCQLGNGSGSGSESLPVQAGDSSFRAMAVAAGDLHSLALKADGTVWAWGMPYANGMNGSSYTPVQVVGLRGIMNIAGGTHHSMAVKHDTTLWTWGSNGHGQLGDGTRDGRPDPVQVPPF